jgi:hypothetical protein
VNEEQNDEFQLLQEDHCVLLRHDPCLYGRNGISTKDNHSTTIGHGCSIPLGSIREHMGFRVAVA